MIKNNYTIYVNAKIPKNVPIGEEYLITLLEKFIKESPVELVPLDRVELWDNPDFINLIVYKRRIVQNRQPGDYCIYYEFVFASDAPFEVSWSEYPEYNK